MPIKFSKKHLNQNTLTVYATRLEDLDPYIVSDGLEQMPASWIRRILKYKKLADRNLAFVTYALIYHYCITNNIDPLMVFWDEKNVPTFLNKDLYISLSHSKNMAILIVDNVPIGADVQYILNDNMIIRDDRLNRLSPQQNLQIKYSDNPEEEFFIQWAIKEAGFKFDQNLNFLKKSWRSLKPYIFNLKVQESYMIAVLTLNKYDHLVLEDVNLKKCFLEPEQYTDNLKKQTLI